MSRVPRRHPPVPAVSQVVSAHLDSPVTIAKPFDTTETWHEVGAVGEPPFENGWRNAEDETFDPRQAPLSFKLNEYGVCFLRGVFMADADIVGATTVFTLPAGYRPENRRLFAAVNYLHFADLAGERALARISVEADGRVRHLDDYNHTNDTDAAGNPEAVRGVDFSTRWHSADAT